MRAFIAFARSNRQAVPVSDQLERAPEVPRVGSAPSSSDGSHAVRRSDRGLAASAPYAATRRVVASVVLVGLALSTALSWAAARVDSATEQRLLEGQSRRAATVLSNAVTNIETPLANTLAALAASRAERDGASVGDAAVFGRLMAERVGPEAQFVSASLFRMGPDGAAAAGAPAAALGGTPGLAPGDPDLTGLLERALAADTTVVARVQVDDRTRIGYALAAPATREVIYAERAVPENRRAPVDQDSAYADLHYAIYLGPDAVTSAMTTTDVDPRSLPLSGRTFETSVPFGDTVLTLVTSPRRHLGGALSARLPVILLVGGLVLTVAAALTARRLVRARLEVDRMYGEQRDVSARLQRALLPAFNPDIPGLDVASEYIAAAEGVDVGGDWYSIVPVGPGRFAFVVGDVSGHGIDAVAVMARVRFTLRAYLSDGDGPGEALRKCAAHVDVEVDGRIATVLVGVGDLVTGEMTLASAGHLPPLLVRHSHGADYVPVPVGPPLGLDVVPYETTTVPLSAGDLFLAYTDGLVERRDESIDVGLARLADAVGGAAVSAGPERLDRLIDDVLAVMVEGGSPGDDVALLVVRPVAVPAPAAP